ncbi:hypothetical protein FPSE5266_20111 [Fusarium pseudograminearum]|nr:hypothetical protein FPSE5266_20111 [Fusarium pseudograminearum]
MAGARPPGSEPLDGGYPSKEHSAKTVVLPTLVALQSSTLYTRFDRSQSLTLYLQPALARRSPQTFYTLFSFHS